MSSEVWPDSNRPILIEPLDDFLARELKAPTFILDPYIPSEGVVFVYAKTSVGKTPFTWQLAKSVASGREFCGLPTRAARVLYVENDTPPGVIHHRLRSWRGTAHPDLYTCQTVAFNLLDPNDDIYKEIKSFILANQIEFVVWNTLSFMFNAPNPNMPNVPAMVYGALKRQMPGICHIVVHHERKTSVGEYTGPSNESFLGSVNWTTLATSTLHLVRAGVPAGFERGAYISVVYEKSQVADYTSVPDWRLILLNDGLTLIPEGDRLTWKIREALKDAPPSEIRTVAEGAKYLKTLKGLKGESTPALSGVLVKLASLGEYTPVSTFFDVLPLDSPPPVNGPNGTHVHRKRILNKENPTPGTSADPSP